MASQPRKRAKRSKESSHAADEPSGASPPAQADVPEVSGRELDLYALKLQVLGPFLFGQQTLCEKALQSAQDLRLLPKDSGVWPAFFDREHWDRAQLIVRVISATIRLWETDQAFKESTLGAKKARPVPSNRSLAEKIQSLGEGLTDCPIADVEVIFKVVRTQVAQFAASMATSQHGEAFKQSMLEKVQLVQTVRLRGNTNFKEGRFRAAIADYTQAVKLCPYSSVLYCNRAYSCMKTGNYWFACVDGLRAMVLRENWEKAYYRCADAWSKLGEMGRALSINEKGQRMCQYKADLERQNKEIQAARTEKSGSTKATKSSSSRRKQAGSKEGGKRKHESREKERVGKMGTVHKAVQKEDTENEPEKLTARQMALEEVGPQGVSPEISIIYGAEMEGGHLLKSSTPFTDFKTLPVPTVHPSISTATLQQLSHQVKVHSAIPIMYVLHAAAWTTYEPTFVPPSQPKTNPATIKDPMHGAHFDEIWCPIPADSKEAESILPPTFCYMPTEKSSPSMPDYMIVKTGLGDL